MQLKQSRLPESSRIAGLSPGHLYWDLKLALLFLCGNFEPVPRKILKLVSDLEKQVRNAIREASK
jgi:hypothetical protein